MKLIGHWKIVAYLAGLVLASGLTGGLIGHGVARRQIDARNDPANWNEHVAHQFDRLVKPTREQEIKVQAHLDDAVRQLQTIRSETIARSTNVIWHLVDKVERELTPEQRRAFQAMKPKSSELTLDVLKVGPPQNGKP
jgi:hypothetical protein